MEGDGDEMDSRATRLENHLHIVYLQRRQIIREKLRNHPNHPSFGAVPVHPYFLPLPPICIEKIKKRKKIYWVKKEHGT